MQNILHARYYNIDEKEQGKYLIQTKSQAKTSGTIFPKGTWYRERNRSKCKTRKASYKAGSYAPKHIFYLKLKIYLMLN